MRRTIATLFLLLAAGPTCLAQDWAKAIFDHTSHNFGVVAVGQKVEHRFPLENIYLEDISIATVRSSCKCLSAKVAKQTLKTYEKGEVVVSADTARFVGRKDATLKVSVTAMGQDGPIPAEVQLHCYLYIRSDVVLQPGEVRFESVTHGAAVAPKKVSIDYAGRSDWQIVRAECDNPHLELKLTETGRNQGRVTYDLLVGLKADAPVGYLREHVVLTTNDENQNATRILVPVEGNVAPTVSARPSPLMLGLLKPGQAVDSTILVRGQKPFRIVDVSGPDDHFQFKWSEGAKAWHVIGITFSAADEAGKINGTIRIQTDVAGSEVVEVKFDGQVVAPSSETPSEGPPKAGTGLSPSPDGPAESQKAAT